MKFQCYIQSSCAISPQHTFHRDIFSEALQTTDTNMLQALQPDYAGLIPANSLRRMSKVLKMGLAAAVQCLAEAGMPLAGAIITGTGKGSLQDMEKFIKDIVTYRETALNPTQFIQSTFNSVNGLIALQQQITQYNNTFVHRGLSFESALLDALLQLAEGKRNVLVGAFDEVTPDQFQIKSHSGWWKREKINSAALLEHVSPGTIAGEGAVFFLLTDQPAPGAAAAIAGIQLLHKPSTARLEAALQQFLATHGLQAGQVDLLLSGRNGDSNYRHFYEQVAQALPGVPELSFKPLSGEYETAHAFGVWLGAQMIRAGKAPEQWFPGGTVFPRQYGTVLLYNQYYGEQHAFILLKKIP
ncbi:MAG TPA: beta-ketoacyl synthase chain length factor [Chitinophaga sp.]